MKRSVRLLKICGVFLVFYLAVSCVSTKSSKSIVTDKIFNYYPSAYLSGNNFDWIYNKNVKITTLKYPYLKDGSVIYSQKIEDDSGTNRKLVLYFKPLRSDLDPTRNKLKIISCVFSYRSGINNQSFVTIHWVSCPYVCNDKKLKNFLNRIF